MWEFVYSVTTSLAWFFCGSCYMVQSSTKRDVSASVFVPVKGLNRRVPKNTTKTLHVQS